MMVFFIGKFVFVVKKWIDCFLDVVVFGWLLWIFFYFIVVIYFEKLIFFE